jgi:hypothetical protein
MYKTDMLGFCSFVCPEFLVYRVNAVFQVNLQTLNIMGNDVHHPLPFRVKVKERVELYLYSPSGPLWRVIG